MHDPDHEHNLDAALAERAFTATSRDGVRWHIQPERLDIASLYHLLFTSDTLITMEQADGPYEPVGIASSQDEALDMISHDYHRRSPENDDLCPEHYALWSRGRNGFYRRDATITKA